MKLRKLVTNAGFICLLDLFQGKGEGGAALELHVLYLVLLLGGANVEKWGDHQEEKFFIDNAVQALIPFQEGHRALLKFYAHFGEGVSLCEKGRNFL